MNVYTFVRTRWTTCVCMYVKTNSFLIHFLLTSNVKIEYVHILPNVIVIQGMYLWSNYVCCMFMIYIINGLHSMLMTNNTKKKVGNTK